MKASRLLRLISCSHRTRLPSQSVNQIGPVSGNRRIGGVSSLLIGLALAAGLAAQTTEDFEPRADDVVTFAQPLSSGSLLVGGIYDVIGGIQRPNLAQTLEDGRLNDSFRPQLDGDVICAAELNDGTILVGGTFTQVQGVDRPYLVHLSTTGSYRGLAGAVNGRVNAIAVQPDGMILVAGQFSEVDGEVRQRLARVDVNGNVDPDFDPNVDGIVYAMLLQADGSIVIGGSFQNVGGLPRNRLARVLADGSVDATFVPNADGVVSSLALQPDGKILAGGAFTQLGGGSATRIARVNADGSLDGSFTAAADDWVDSIALQADGSLFIGGEFTTVNSTARNRVAKLGANGTLDAGFNPNANSVVRGLSLQEDGKLLVQGGFSYLGSDRRTGLARVSNATAATQSASVTGTSQVDWMRGGGAPEMSRVWVEWREATTTRYSNAWSPLGEATRVAGGWRLDGLSLPGSGWIRFRGRVHGGWFNGSSSVMEEVVSYGGAGQPDLQLTIEEPEGSNSYSVLASGSTHDFGAVDATGSYSSSSSTRTFRLNELGGSYHLHVDRYEIVGPGAQRFSARPDDVSPGGYDEFTISYRAQGAGQHEATLRIWTDDHDHEPFELHLRGYAEALERSYQGPSWFPLAVAPEESGKVMIAGGFLNYGYSAANRMIRVYESGTVDSNFSTNIEDGAVYTVVSLDNGQYLIGGSFTRINGQTRDRLALLNNDGSLDASFNPGANGTVRSLSVQPDGKIIATGEFTIIASTSRNRVARLEADGTIDSGFLVDANSTVQSCLILPGGDLLFCGSFTSVNATTRVGLCKVDSSGVVDAAYNPNPNNTVQCMVRQTDGKILIGGFFTGVGGYAYNRLARLLPDGSLDFGFRSALDDYVTSLSVQADGRILVSGAFDTVGGVARPAFARIQPNGSLDVHFQPAFDAADLVYATALSMDGTIHVAGNFNLTSQADVGNTRDYFAQFKNDIFGSAGFETPANGELTFVQSGGAPLASQVRFETWNGTGWDDHGYASPTAEGWAMSGLTMEPGGWARVAGHTSGGYLNGSSARYAFEGAYGTIKPDIAVTYESTEFGEEQWLNAGLPRTFTITNQGSAELNQLSVTMTGTNPDDFNLTQPLELALAPGESTTFTCYFAPLGVGTRNAYIDVISNDYDELPKRIYVRGTSVIPPDVFTPTLSDSGYVYSTAVQADGYVLVGGDFTTVDGETRTAIARFTGDGVVDHSFQVTLGRQSAGNPYVRSIIVQSDGKLLLGGLFDSVNGTSTGGLVRLLADGSLDPGFTPAFTVFGEVMALQDDDKILCRAGTGELVRLMPDGTEDVGFARSSIGVPSSIAVQPDGRVLVASGNSVVRKHADGTADGSFSATANTTIRCLLVEPDGKVLVGGDFTAMNGVSSARLVRLESNGVLDTSYTPNPNSPVYTMARQANGKLIIGGVFSNVSGIARMRVAKLNADGTLDLSFDPSANDYVYDVTLQDDGRVLLGGRFRTIAGTNQQYVARVPNNEVASNALVINSPGSIDWQRGGSTAGLSAAGFELWDGSAWTDLGSATYSGGGWQLTGLNLPVSGWIRARGAAKGGYGSGSAGISEMVAAYGGALASSPDLEVSVDGIEVTSQSGSAFVFAQQDWLTSSAPKVVTLTNAGTEDLNLGSVQLLGAHKEDFQLTAPATALLVPGASTTVEVVFHPRSAKQRGCELIIASNDPDESPYALKFEGYGMHRDPVFYPDFQIGSSSYGINTAIEQGESLLFGGNVQLVDGISPPAGLVRFGADGQMDLSFDPPVVQAYTAAVAPDGQYFTSHQGRHLKRVNPVSGAEDAGFVSGIASPSAIHCIVPMPDGRVLVGGNFGTPKLMMLQADGTVDGSFTAPAFDQPVYSVLPLQDGKFLVAGLFTTVNGGSRTGLARLHTNGSLDTGFAAAAPATAYVVAMAADGTLWAGGPGQLFRVQADGSLDAGFTKQVGHGSTVGHVYSLAPQADGSMLVGGEFDTVDGLTRHNVARVLADDSLDELFNPGTGGEIYNQEIGRVQGVTLRSDGSVILAGIFTEVGGVPRSGVASLPNNVVATNTPVLTTLDQMDWLQSGSAPSYNRVWVERWDGSGWTDRVDAVAVSGGWQATALGLSGSGWVRVVGETRCGQYNGSVGHVQQVLEFGGGDLPQLTVESASGDALSSGEGTFDFGNLGWPNASDPIVFTVRNTGGADLIDLDVSYLLGNVSEEEFEITPPADSVLAPGESTTFSVRFMPITPGVRSFTLGLWQNDVTQQPFKLHFEAEVDYGSDLAWRNQVPGGTPYYYGYSLLRRDDGSYLASGGYSYFNALNPDGTLSEDFTAKSRLSGTQMLDDGKVLAWGFFSTISGVSRPYLIRYHEDGSVDGSFAPTLNGYVSGLALDDQGRMVICGGFTNVNGEVRNRIARLQADGSLDISFNPDANNVVYAAQIMEDGGIYIGGNFSTVGGTARGYLARLNPDGSLDAGFPDLALNRYAYTLGVSADGQLLVGGNFSASAGNPIGSLIRVSSAGVIDASFANSDMQGTVQSLGVQADGKIVVGGGFVKPSASGSYWRYLVRLHPDGTLDTGFNPSPNSSVFGVTLEMDGSLSVAGSFNSIGGVPNLYLQRLQGDGSADRSLAVDESSMTWSFVGSHPMPQRVYLDAWDGSSWVPQSVSRGAGVFTSSGLSLPASGWVRLKAWYPSGAYNASGRWVEEVVSYGTTPVADLTVESPVDVEISNGALLDFGSVESMVAASPRTVVLRNDGGLPLTNLALSVTGAHAADFVVSPLLTTSLNPGESTQVTLTMTPSTTGAREALLEISSNDVDEALVLLTLQGTGERALAFEALPSTPLSGGETLDLGSVSWEESGEVQMILIRNDGTTTVSGIGVNLTGSGAAAYQVTGPAQSTLNPGEQTTVDVVLDTSLGGVQTANLEISSSEAPGSPFSVGLTGVCRYVEGNAFNVGEDSSVQVQAVAPLADGSLLVGLLYYASGYPAGRLARVAQDGSLLSGYQASFTGGAVKSLAVFEDGRVLVGGDFDAVNGVARSGVAIVDQDGALDPSFDAGLMRSGSPTVVLVENALITPDGKILVGGSFDEAATVPVANLARFHADGTLDSGFTPNPNSWVYSMAVQADGMVLVSGSFTEITGVAQARVARLQSSGALDATFDPSLPNGTVNRLLLQPDGKVIIGGAFTEVNTISQANLARLNSDGTLDVGFAPVPEGSIRGLALAADGSLMAGMIGAPTSRNLIRVANDGTVDSGFSPVFSGSIYSVALDGSASIWAGGSFSVNGEPSKLVRIANDVSPLSALSSPLAGQLLWQRGASSASLDQVSFLQWDGTDWQFIADGVAVSGGWEVTGLSLPSDGLIRAIGRTRADHPGWVTERFELGSPAYPVMTVLDDEMQEVEADGSGVDFGSEVDVDVVFTIRNDGNAYLDGIQVSMEGVSAGQFTLTPPAVTSLAPGATTTLAVRFTPNAWGRQDARIRIEAITPDDKVVEVALSGQTGGVDASVSAPGGTGTVYQTLELPNGDMVLGTNGYLKWVSADGTLLRNIQMEYYYSSRYFSRWYSANPWGLALQDDGKVLVIGNFTRLTSDGEAFSRTGIARFHPDGTPDASFNAQVDNNSVFSMLIQSDGKILLAGGFSNVAGVSRRYVCRLHPDGSLDSSFNPDPASVSSTVYSMALQQDGRILVGKSGAIERLTTDGSLDVTFSCSLSGQPYTMLRTGDQWLIGGNLSSVGGQPRLNLARIHDDGSLDTDFSMDTNSNGYVYATVALNNGKVLLSGSFTQLGGESSPYIAQLNADGTLDAGFKPGVNSQVFTMVPAPDGSVMIGGGITVVNGTAVNRICRLLPIEAAEADLLVDGTSGIELVMGGSAPAIESMRLAYLDGGQWVEPALPERTADGWSLTGLQMPAGGWVMARGRISVGDQLSGSSKAYRFIRSYGEGVEFPDITVLDELGQAMESIEALVEFGDMPYPQELAQKVLTIRNDGAGALTDLQFVMTGSNANAFEVDAAGLTTLLPGEEADITIRFQPIQTGSNTARLEILSNDADELPFYVNVSGGYPQDGLGQGADATVNTVLPASDGSVIVGGSFNSIGGVDCARVARIMSNGEVDPAFKPGANNSVWAIAELDDGSYIIGGNFTQVGGYVRRGLARLLADGTVDPSWQANVSQVQSLLVMPDGRLLVGGSFTSIAGVGREGVAVLHADGTPDLSFIPPSWYSAYIKTVDLLDDGSVLMGGTIQPTLPNSGNEALGVVKLSANGTWDPTFNVPLVSSSSPRVDAILRTLDGKLWIAGKFQEVNGEVRNDIALLLPDGSVDLETQLPTLTGSSSDGLWSMQGLAGGGFVGGGSFTSLGGSGRYVGMIGPEGELVPEFAPNSNGYVYAVGIGANGVMTLGGGFTSLGGIERNRLGRVGSLGSHEATLEVADSTHISWMRGASAPRLERVHFEMKVDGSWVEIGPANRVEGGWIMEDLDLPQSGEIRAVGRSQCGFYNGSSMRVAQELSYALPDPELTLQPAGVFEGEVIATEVGVLELVVFSPTTGPHAFSLVAGEGDDDNGDFSIVDDRLLTAAVFDHEEQAERSIRVRVEDSGGFVHEQMIVVSIFDDRDEDADGDGLTEAQEEDLYGTSDLTKDSDGDLFEDGYEVGVGLDPSIRHDGNLDRDGDRQPDWLELRMGTDPLVSNASPLSPRLSVSDAGVVTIEVGPGANGVGLRVHSSADLNGPWDLIQDYPGGLPAGQKVDLIDDNPHEGKGFYRVTAYPIAPDP